MTDDQRARWDRLVVHARDPFIRPNGGFGIEAELLVAADDAIQNRDRLVEACEKLAYFLAYFAKPGLDGPVIAIEEAHAAVAQAKMEAMP